MRVTELPDKLRARGLTVVEVSGWATRGDEFPSRPDGALRHWDAVQSKHPTAGLGVITNGRSDLPGPLAQVYQSRHVDGSGLDVAYVVASGRANHAGAGEWNGISGNSKLLGVEIAWSGPEESFGPKRILTSELIMRALLDCCTGTNTNDVCFPVGTLILTESGLTPIEEISIGTKVFTHKNRFRTVIATGNRLDDTIIVKGQGHPGLEVTENHPFLVQTQHSRRLRGEMGTHLPRTIGEEWVPAVELEKKWWCSPAIANEESLPRSISPEQAWIIGHYLAEGWALQQGRDPIALAHACAAHEVDEIIARANDAGWHAATSRKKNSENSNVIRIACGEDFVGFVREQFNEKAHQKEIPSWVFFAPKDVRYSLLQGYLYGDGWVCKNPAKNQLPGFYEARTVSKKLAVGMRLLAHSLGWATSMHIAVKGGPGKIRGRTVIRKTTYQIRFRPYESSRAQGFFTEKYFCGRVKSVAKGQDSVRVYNITVEEDESYVADGIVVHNCEHREYAKPSGRKIDTNLDGNTLRRRMAELGPTPAPITPPITAKDRLRSGESLKPGQFIMSTNGRFTLVHQTDGNVVVYDGPQRPETAVWHTKTSGKKTSKLVMQPDGNLVLYSTLNQALWHTGTNGNTGAIAVLQSDGNFVVYKGSKALWDSKDFI